MIYSNRPIKLQDCHQHGMNADSELFLVEGDSASAMVGQLRNAATQAVLPMQGKPLNTIKANPEKVEHNPLFKALIDALGADWGDQFNISKCRYQRIVLLMDPDADGIHCSALMLMFFYRWMRPLLEHQRILLIRAPLGEVVDTNSGEIQYAYTEPQFIALCKQQKTATNQKLITAKYRGLAGISGEKLIVSCIDPLTRKCSVMDLSDAEMAINVFNGIDFTP